MIKLIFNKFLTNLYILNRLKITNKQYKTTNKQQINNIEKNKITLYH